MATSPHGRSRPGGFPWYCERERTMSDTCVVRLGAVVPDFEMDVYAPEKEDFDKVSLADLKSQGKWTILFFYPADFTFV